MTMARARFRWPRRRAVLDGTWDTAGSERPRAVVCTRDGVLAVAAARVLGDDGCEVRACSGPDESHLCALLQNGSCPLVDGSDVVVDLFGLGDAEHWALLAALRVRYPELPVVADVAPGDRHRDPRLLEEVELIERPLRSSHLVASVDRALAGCRP